LDKGSQAERSLGWGARSETMSIPTEEVSDTSNLEISTATASSALWIISSAFEKFKSILSSEDAAELITTTLDDFRNTLESVQLDQASRGRLGNFGRLRLLIGSFQQLERVLEVYLNVSPYLPAIWGSLKFVVKV
jgi:hypothetical protein